MYKLLIFFSFLLFSCQSMDENSKEATDIPREAMVDIMIDIAMADAMVEGEGLETNELIYQKKLSFYEDIFTKHGYTPEEFENSYEFYSDNLMELSAIYDEVLEHLSQKEIELNQPK